MEVGRCEKRETVIGVGEEGQKGRGRSGEVQSAHEVGVCVETLLKCDDWRWGSGGSVG